MKFLVFCVWNKFTGINGRVSPLSSDSAITCIEDYKILLGVQFSTIDSYREYSELKSPANKSNYMVQRRQNPMIYIPLIG